MNQKGCSIKTANQKLKNISSIKAIDMPFSEYATESEKSRIKLLRII